MPKSRKINTKNLRPRVLILCEGEKTEPNYFRGIKADKSLEDQLTALRIEVLDTAYNTALELVREAHDLQQEAFQEYNPYDAVWVVFDRDGYNKHPQAFALAQKHGIHIAFSSISFEYWFLLHFAKINIPFSRSREVESYLREHEYYRGYKKSHNHYDRLKHFTHRAIANAKWLRQQIGYTGKQARYKLNPYTDVDKLVAYLLHI